MSARRTLPCSRCGIATDTTYGLCAEHLREMGVESRRRQGLPDMVTDAAALDRLAALIRPAIASTAPPPSGPATRVGGAVDGVAGSTRATGRYGEVTAAGLDERIQAAAPRQTPTKKTRPVRADRVHVPDAG